MNIFSINNVNKVLKPKEFFLKKIIRILIVQSLCLINLFATTNYVSDFSYVVPSDMNVITSAESNYSSVEEEYMLTLARTENITILTKSNDYKNRLPNENTIIVEQFTNTKEYANFINEYQNYSIDIKDYFNDILKTTIIKMTPGIIIKNWNNATVVKFNNLKAIYLKAVYVYSDYPNDKIYFDQYTLGTYPNSLRIHFYSNNIDYEDFRIIERKFLKSINYKNTFLLVND